MAPRQKPSSEVREAILVASRALLAEKRYDEITVADILAAAGVARGSFYFYFEGKADVLAELVTTAIGEGHEAATSWLGHEDAASIAIATRRSIADGAHLWRAQAPVLRAIVENWRTSPKLTDLWLAMMNGFTASTVERIEADRANGAAAAAGDAVDTVDAQSLAATLTWLGERLYYLAALGVPPFDDEEKLVDALTHIWMTSLYGMRG
jgi:TetR/AcrR family transcriptional regulator, ethionamide resistance regulator